MCQGDPIGAGVLVAIMGPSKINETNIEDIEDTSSVD